MPGCENVAVVCATLAFANDTDPGPLSIVQDALKTPGGTGKPSPPLPPAQHLSRAPAVANIGAWRKCPFPAEADIENINNTTVTLVVTVGEDGRAKSVTVLNGGAYGFGKMARECAFRNSFVPGLDRNGKPVTKSTAPFTVRFTR